MGRALLLAGGTAVGAVQVHVMEQLLATHGLAAYDVVAGVSVGAVNGVMFAARRLPQLRGVWQSLRGWRSFMRLNYVGLLGIGAQGLLSLKPLRRRIEANVSLERIAPHVRFTCGVVDFETATYYDLPHTKFMRNDRFVDALLASSAQPALMHGYRVETEGPGGPRRWCFDGGVKHYVPMLEDPQSFDHIDVVLCNPPERLPKYEPRDVNGFFEIFARNYSLLAVENVLIADVERLLDWEEHGAKVTLYAPEAHEREFDARPETIARRLDVVGPWMWANPWSPESFLRRWRES